MRDRDKLYALAEALAAPKTVYEIIMALNAPDNLSPYKKKMTDMILEEVSLEIFIEKLYEIYEIDKAQEEVRRENILQGLKDEKAAEQIIHREAFQYATDRPRRLLERGDNIMELELKAKYLQDILNVERPKLDEYEKGVVANKKVLTDVESKWESHQKIQSEKYSDAVEELYSLPSGMKERLEKAFMMVPPSKLLQINRQIIREVGDDEKMIEQCANTMAQKGGFIRELKTLDILGSTDVRMTGQEAVEKNGVVEESVLKPSALLALRKKIPPMPKVDKEKEMLVDAIRADNKRADFQSKATKVYAMEKALNKIHDKILVLKNQPELQGPAPRI